MGWESFPNPFLLIKVKKQAAEADLFDDETDAENAYGEEADEDSIKHFTENNLVHEL